MAALATNLDIFFSGYELTGLARGGEQLAKLKRNYAKAVELLVELASLQVDGRKKCGGLWFLSSEMKV